MRFYPPLFFQRIWVVKFHEGFKGVDIRVKKSWFNQNYNRSIFGGTIFSTADPFYPVLLHQMLAAKGYKPIVWLKSCHIQYIKPAYKKLNCTLLLAEDVIAQAETILKTDGKFVTSLPAEMINDDGVICVSLLCEVYVRDLNFTDKSSNLTA